MDEIKTEEIPTKNKVRFSEVAQKVLESNKEKKKYDLENDAKVIEAKEKVKTKRQEIKEKIQKEYKSVFAKGSKLYENQYKYNVQEKPNYTQYIKHKKIKKKPEKQKSERELYLMG